MLIFPSSLGQQEEEGKRESARPRSQSSFVDWTRSVASRLWSYASFTPPPSPPPGDPSTTVDEPKYFLVDRASVVASSAASVHGDSGTLLAVPIPSFRRASRPPRAPNRGKGKSKAPEDVSEEACHERHRAMERMEHRELKRERELDQYSAYMEKLRREFPSLFNIEPETGYRRKQRRNTE